MWGVESKGVDKLKNIVFAFMLYALYIFLFSQFMEFLLKAQVFFKPPVKFELFMSLVFSPLVEELIFRVGPLNYVRNSPEKVVPMIIMSSALFGYLHYGPISWPIQGVLGVVLCWLYIKNNYSYWSIVLLHALWNAYAVFILEKLV